jgi:hypothetical protein
MVRNLHLSLAALSAGFISEAGASFLSSLPTLKATERLQLQQSVARASCPHLPPLFSAANAVTTLTDETTWNMRIVLRGVPTERGKKVDEIFSVTAKFVEETGYEPPQGYLVQVPKENDRLQIVSSRWKLSEDPNERKDGLWVWGLFEEPLYPFLLLQLETSRVPLPGRAGRDDASAASSADAIRPLKLYAQIRHRRDKAAGVVLEGGQLSVRKVETIKVDPFGAAKVEIYDDLDVGRISVQPF